MRRRRRRRHQVQTESREPIPFDPTRTAGGIAGVEAGTGVAHGVFAVVIALGLAILVDPLRRVLRAFIRK